MLLLRMLLLSAFVLASVHALAQTDNENSDPVYGHDPLLYNGRMYTFFPAAGTTGYQYLNAKFDSEGSIKIRGTLFTNVSLNYDVYNQFVVLKYSDALNSSGLIEISPAWLESFTLNGCNFEFVAGADTSRRIYQVIGNGENIIMYFHHKELLIDTRTTARNFYFPDATRDMFILRADRMIRFNTNRTFIHAFSENNQPVVKKYMRKNKIKVKRSTDLVMTELINFCNTLSGS